LFFESRPLGVLRPNRRGVAAKLDFALPQATGRMVRQSLAHFVDARFLTAGTGVEYEDFHVLGDGSGLLGCPGYREATDLPNKDVPEHWDGKEYIPSAGRTRR